MAYENLYDSGKMPRTKAVIEQLSESVARRWELSVRSHKPGWWGESAAENNTLVIKPIPGGNEVFWKQNGGAYDFMKIVEEGREAYSIKDALLSGPRARIGKNGRYAIVPMKRNQDGTNVNARNNDIAGSITKTGSYSDAQGKTRNNYSYSKTGKGNVYRVKQSVKGGKTQSSYMKFMMVSEKSSGWIYPRIEAGQYGQKMQETADIALEKLLKPNGALSRAISDDLMDIFRTVK